MMIIEEFEMSYIESTVDKFDTDMTVWVNKLIEKYGEEAILGSKLVINMKMHIENNDN